MLSDNSTFINFPKTVQDDEQVNGQHLVKKHQLYLSNQKYQVSNSFVEITFHAEDETGTQQWRPYRDSKLYKVK